MKILFFLFFLSACGANSTPTEPEPVDKTPWVLDRELELFVDSTTKEGTE